MQQIASVLPVNGKMRASQYAAHIAIPKGTYGVASALKLHSIYGPHIAHVSQQGGLGVFTGCVGVISAAKCIIVKSVSFAQWTGQIPIRRMHDLLAEPLIGGSPCRSIRDKVREPKSDPFPVTSDTRQ